MSGRVVGLLANPWVAVPLALALLLAFSRAARQIAGLRPLVRPFAASVLALTALVLGGYHATPAEGAIGLLLLAPALILVVRSVRIALQTAFRRHQGYDAPALLESVVAVLLYGVGAGFIAHRWLGFELTPFLATSAVVGAVVGLALQDTLGNLFAGIALHTEGPFRVSDWIKVGDSEGQVEEVSWRAVSLRTWDGDRVTIPNNEVARHAVRSFSVPRQPHSRVVTIGVNFHTPPNRVIAVLQDVVDQVELVTKDPPPQLRMIGFHDSAIVYEIRYWVARYEDYRVAESDIHRLIWYHFRRHAIEIPFPIRNVYLHQVEGHEVRESPAQRLERALRSIDLFRPLNDEELRAAVASFRHLHYARGEKIIEEGAPGDSFFVIDAGEAEVSKTLAGRDRPLARLMEGQFFGEISLLTGEARSATVTASSDTDLFRLDKAGFEKILVANPEIAVEISAILSQRRSAISRAEDDTSAHPANEPPAEIKARILTRIRSYFGL